MKRGRIITEFLHTLVLGIWLGGLGVAGFAAGRTFRVMRDLDPALPGYAGYEGAHWSIAAGRVVLPLFFIVDVVQFVCLLIAGITFAVATGLLGLSLRRLSTFVRAFLLLALIAVLSYRFFALQPIMMQSLVAYWNAAGAGLTDLALEHKSAFDHGHTLDRRLMSATALMVLAAIGATLWSLLDREPPAVDRKKSELQVPMLAKS